MGGYSNSKVHYYLENRKSKEGFHLVHGVCWGQGKTWGKASEDTRIQSGYTFSVFFCVQAYGQYALKVKAKDKTIAQPIDPRCTQPSLCRQAPPPPPEGGTHRHQQMDSGPPSWL